MVVVRGGLPADQDDLLAPLGPFRRRVGCEHHTPHRRAGRGIKTSSGRLFTRLEFPRDHRLEQLLQPIRIEPQQPFVLADEALLPHVEGHDPFGEGGPLAHPGLEEPQLAPLDGELDVAHVAVVALEGVHALAQLAVGLRVDLLQVLQTKRVPDAGHHVLALRVREVVAVRALLAGGRVAGERHSRAAVVAHVAEHHGHDVHGGPEVVADLVLPPVVHGPLAVPRAEHRLDGLLELLARVLREVLAGLVPDDLLELLGQPPEVVRVEVGVLRVGALRGLRLVELLLEPVARDVQHDLAEHLDETPVHVPGEAVVGGLRGQALDAVVVQAEVENRVHHPGHGELRSGANGDQQRIGRFAELLPHGLFQPLEMLFGLLHEARGEGVLLQIGQAGLGADGESGGDGQAHVRHLGEVGALPPEEVLHVPVALVEVVDELGAHGCLRDRVRSSLMTVPMSRRT